LVSVITAASKPDNVGDAFRTTPCRSNDDPELTAAGAAEVAKD
jgi:hypothetical protein